MQAPTYNRTLLKQVDLSNLIDSITQTAKEVIDDAKTVSLSSMLDPKLTEQIAGNAAKQGVSVNAYLNRLVSNSSRPRNAGEKTLSDVFGLYLKSSSITKRYSHSANRDELILGFIAKVKAVIGDVPIEEITASDLEAVYKKELSKHDGRRRAGVWGATKLKALHDFTISIFKFAATEHALNVNVPERLSEQQIKTL